MNLYLKEPPDRQDPDMQLWDKEIGWIADMRAARTWREARKRAEEIIHKVNTYDELVQALEKADELLLDIHATFQGCETYDNCYEDNVIDFRYKLEQLLQRAKGGEDNAR